MTSSEPLTVLLAKAWTAQTIEIDNAVEVAGAATARRRFRISLAMWANGLRVIDEEGTPLEEVRRRARARCNVVGLERWGWVTVGDQSAGDGRRDGYGTSRGLGATSVLRPTRAGTTARHLWPETVQAVERRWRDRFGLVVVDAFRAEAAAFTEGMPWAVPEVHPGDGFRSHLIDGGSDDSGDRPLVILLGQALAALTVRAETASSVSVALGENLLRALEDAAVTVRDLPTRTGLSKEAISMAVNFSSRRSLARLGPGRSLALTTGGAEALADHRTRVAGAAGSRGDGLRAALEAVFSQPTALAAGLEPPPGCWRGERPYLAQTRRLLANPIAALPRHPMVLHRGGWPDGS